MRYALILPLLLLGFALSDLSAQETDPCRECPLPGGRGDSVMDVRFRNGTLLFNVMSARRLIIDRFGEERQGLRLRFRRGGECSDTTVFVEEIDWLRIGGLGLGGQPTIAPVQPAREFYRDADAPRIPSRFFELSLLAGYAGEDESAREIGFANTLFGGEILLAPFGDLLGDRLALAFGAGGTSEGGRLRIPLGGHLRYTFLGNVRSERSQRFVPSECQFGLPDDPPLNPASGGNLVEVPGNGIVDSTVYYIREQTLVRDPFRPYLFAEGGFLLNGTFDGSGSRPSVNPEDYGQHYAGAGVGAPLFNVLTVAVGYRYMRLNLRTPCPACEDRFVVNTNNVHAVVLKAGLNLSF